MDVDGYINEAGTINVKRLQSILDEMALWERDVFEKEFSDLSWYKGKQREKGGKGKTKEVESAKKQEGLGASHLSFSFDILHQSLHYSSYEAPTRNI